MAKGPTPDVCVCTPSSRRGVPRPGTGGTSFLAVLFQPRLISLAPAVPCRLFNDNCILLICQPFIKVFPGERQRKKISNLFIRSTNYPNWTLHLHVCYVSFWRRVGWSASESFGENREKRLGDAPSDWASLA